MPMPDRWLDANDPDDSDNEEQPHTLPRSDDDISAVHSRVRFQSQAHAMTDLMEHPGWAIIKKIIRPSIKIRIMDADDREAFVYEAIRAQALMEVLQLPRRIVQQYQRQHPNGNGNGHNNGYNSDHKPQ